jgi:DNA-binding transcriptional ArsR family regulator
MPAASMFEFENRVDSYQVFKALGHPDRLHFVRQLRDGERCVCELVESVDSAWSTVSKHLSVLKDAGILADEKRGLQVFYRLKLPCVLQMIDCLEGTTHAQQQSCSCWQSTE